MTAQGLKNLERHVAAIVDGIAAWPWRKRALREELFLHMQAAYAEELERTSDGEKAAREVLRRWGDGEIFRRELADSVSGFERFSTRWFFNQEMPMKRWLVIAVCVLFMAAWAVMIPDDAQFMIGALVMLAVMGLLRLLRTKLGENWWAKGHVPWLAGFFGILFGTAIILPALAKMNRAHTLDRGPETFLAIAGPLSIGVIITLVGLGLVIWRIGRRVVKSA